MTIKGAGNKKILFVLSVDTEEEWDWSGPFPQKDFSVSNVARLADFQQMCDEIGIKPTYFVDYAVADDAAAVKVLKGPVAENTCEIGAHLHPWCNPPYFGHVGEKESHVVNLPIEQVEEKLSTLVTQLTDQFGFAPRSFRTGRWGIDGKVMQLLVKYGFTVDSSVLPFFQTEYFSCKGAPLLPYRPSLNNPLMADADVGIIEIPVTAGFNRENFGFCERLHNTLSHPAISWTRLVGIAWHTRLLRKSYLIPELFDAHEMLSLCRAALRNNHPVLHMFLHSSSLIDNDNSTLGKRNAYAYISDTVRQVVTQLQQEADIQFCTISEAAGILQQKESS
jgi:hypothetical protein